MTVIFQTLVRTIQRTLFGIPLSKNDIQTKLAEQTTNTALSCLRTGNWVNLRQQFVPLLRYFVTEQLLEKGWKLFEVMFGPIEHVGSPTYSCGWFILTATVPVSFKRAKMNATLQMTPTGHLFGLNFSPQLPSTWKTPSYVTDTTALRNTNMRFGTGLFKVGGTLTLPAGKPSERYPCVVLLGGSGPTDRDSSIGALKPFKDIALGLASNNNIAVCRIDKTSLALRLWYRLFRRNKQGITLTGEYGYALDAIRRIKSNPDIRSDKVYILGHSLGGLMAAHLAAVEDSVAGCILMATPSESIYRCAIRQFRYIASLGEGDDNDGSRSLLSDAEELGKQAAIADSPTLSLDTPADQLPFGIGPAYWLECRALNPANTTQQINKPILILQGGRDYQVTVDDCKSLHASLEGNKNAEFRLYDSLNHCFVTGNGPSGPAEYNLPGNVEWEVVQDISEWVRRRSDEIAKED
jgi:uncharacterized protein